MKYLIVVIMTYSFLCASVSVSCDDSAVHETGNGMTVTMDELRTLEGDDWEGSLSYLNYGSEKRSSIPVKVAIKVLDENTLQYAIQYPGEEQHNAKELLKLSRDGSHIDGYDIIGREQTAGGMLVLTTEGKGRDDDRPADIQLIYTVSADRFNIRKNVRFKSSGAYFNRNEYSFKR